MIELSKEALRSYALASVAIALLLALLSFATAAVRVRRKQFVNPEDASRFGTAVADAEHPDVQRVKRAHTNLLENASAFFVIGALYVVTGATPRGALAYFGFFVAARLLHVLFYLRGVQPWRTISHVASLAAILGMMVHVVRAAW